MNTSNILPNQDSIVHILFKGKIKRTNGFIIVLMTSWDRLSVLFRKSWKFNVMIVSLQTDRQTGRHTDAWKMELKEYIFADRPRQRIQA